MAPGRPAGLPAQRRLIAALRDPHAFPHPAAAVELVETHISWVLLAGDYAYKIKKALDLGFLDHTTLARRRQSCLEELRLNRRTAADIYLEVVAIAGTPRAPRLRAIDTGNGGDAGVIEYAVRMRRFDRDQELDALVDRGAFGSADAAALGNMIARFHDAAARDAAGAFADPATVLTQALENFGHLPPAALPADERALLAPLQAWTRAEHARVAPLLAARRRDGRIRECHGDLHLANLVRHDARLVAFDCIEFAPALRWIDVVADLAFTLMDLHLHGRADLARLVLDAWLAHGGDYAGVPLLRFYLVYRAMVRVKVAAIRAAQRGPGAADRHAARRARAAHLRLAFALTQRSPPLLVLTHGLSGAGKSAASAALIAARDWIRLRSDVERRRLADDGTGAAPAAPGRYTAAMTERVYRHLADRADRLVADGWGVVVDATFLRREQRQRFAALAAARQVPLVIVALDAPRSLLEARIAARAAHGGDASEATVGVLDLQIAALEPLDDDERRRCVRVDAALPLDGAALARAVAERAVALA
ncbi:MAG: AAA family ATPase [Burkholderiales bacterium]|nr:AAA family ATPase [Burkholderiales bacterium]